MSIGKAMNVIMWPPHPETPYKSWQAVKEEFTQNHTAVRSQINHSLSIVITAITLKYSTKQSCVAGYAQAD